MSEKRDYYEILGASKTDSKEELKSKYRKLAIKYHPDKNPDDKVAEEKFKEISEAYNTLSDDSKRRMYDQFGHQAPNGGQPGHNPFGRGGFEDIFNAAFNFRGGFNQGPQKGRDLKVDVIIEFMDAVHGITKNVIVNKNTLCDLCNGSGCKEGTQKTTCSVCNGSGSVVQDHGGFKLQTTCTACHGEGKIISTPCEKCMGRGHVSTAKTLSVTIPAGVNDGNRILLSGEGDNIDTSIPPGDLHLFIRVKPHTSFQRNGQDIMYEAEISFVQAILGDTIVVPSLYSDNGKELIIPKGTQYGEILKLDGEGVVIPNTDSKGSLLIKIIIKIPTSLTPKQEKLLKGFN